MPNTINPLKARIVRDVKYFRSKLKKDPNVKKEIKDHLKKKFPVKYANPSDAELAKADMSSMRCLIANAAPVPSDAPKQL